MTESELAVARAYIKQLRRDGQATDLLKLAERLLADAIPSLDNGMPRVDWEAPGARRIDGAPSFTAIITEKAPITLLAGDSGCELVFESFRHRVKQWPWSGVVRAVRREEAPQIVGPWTRGI